MVLPAQVPPAMASREALLLWHGLCTQAGLGVRGRAGRMAPHGFILLLLAPRGSCGLCRTQSWPHPSYVTTGFFPHGGRVAWPHTASMAASTGACGTRGAGGTGAALGTRQQPWGAGGPPGHLVISGVPEAGPCQALAAISEPAPPSSDTQPGCPCSAGRSPGWVVALSLSPPAPQEGNEELGGQSQSWVQASGSRLLSMSSASQGEAVQKHQSAKPVLVYDFFLQKAQFLTGLLRGTRPNLRAWQQKPAATLLLSLE